MLTALGNPIARSEDNISLPQFPKSESVHSDGAFFMPLVPDGAILKSIPLSFFELDSRDILSCASSSGH